MHLLGSRIRSPWGIVVVALVLVLSACQKDPIAQALETLEKGAPDERLQAAQILVQANRARVAEDVLARIPDALQRALEDENPEVRLVVAQGVRSWANPELTRAAVAAMRKDVLSEDPEIARRAATVLESIPTEESTQAMAVALQSSHPEVRSIAARTLQRRNASLDTENRVRMLLSLRDYESVVALSPEALPILRDLLDADPLLRAASGVVLARIGTDEDRTRAAEAILPDLESEDAHIRAAAAQALGALHSESATAALQNLATNDPDPEVRAAAQIALSVVQDDVVSLTRALEDPNPTVQIHAILGLRFISDPAVAVEPVVRLLRRTTNKALANEAIKTLGVCGAEAVPTLLQAIKQEPEWNIRLRLVQALTAASHPEAVSSEQLLTLYDLYEQEVNDVVKSELGQLLVALQGTE